MRIHSESPFLSDICSVSVEKFQLPATSPTF